jgi:hypothetical protein
MIDDAIDKRRLGPNHDEINRHDFAKARYRRMIGHIEHDSPPQVGRAGIAGRNEKRCEQRTIRKSDGDGMFAAAGTKKKNIHDELRYSRWRLGKSHKFFELTPLLAIHRFSRLKFTEMRLNTGV